ncbi:SagB family peptide dehydrogenase [Clostridiaceae bacterium M8S5]|nr:SagB family peptide dehydrogenase [Clostridiaceae bacterium M8S5]
MKKNGKNKAMYKQIYHFNTQYLGISSYTDTTVVRMQHNILNGGIFSQNRYKSEEYLLNFRGNNNYLGNRIGASDFYGSGGLATLTQKELGENLDSAILLPEPQKIKTSISKAIKNRRSVRKYREGKMSLKDLSNILYYSSGVSGKDENKLDYYEEPLVFKLRNVPSGGGLYPIKLYFYCNNVKGLEEGIYVYYPENHAIHIIKDKEKLLSVTTYADFASIDVSKVNMVILYVYDLFINSRKYGDIGAAFAFIEIGEMAQNIQLISTALGYGACDIGGYDKGLVESELEIDGLTKHLLHVTIVGHEGEED